MLGTNDFGFEDRDYWDHSYSLDRFKYKLFSFIEKEVDDIEKGLDLQDAVYRRDILLSKIEILEKLTKWVMEN